MPQPVERSTYVLASSLALLLLFWQWRPLGGVVWDVQDPVGRAVLHAGFAFGWLLVLVTTFLINHFDLFGLRQVWLHLRGRPYQPLPFTTPGPYRLVRHPLYVGWLFAFWSTPTMTVTHLLFAVRHHRLHPDRDPLRGARPGRGAPRVCELPRARADAGSHDPAQGVPGRSDGIRRGALLSRRDDRLGRIGATGPSGRCASSGRPTTMDDDARERTLDDETIKYLEVSARSFTDPRVRGRPR